MRVFAGYDTFTQYFDNAFDNAGGAFRDNYGGSTAVRNISPDTPQVRYEQEKKIPENMTLLV